MLGNAGDTSLESRGLEGGEQVASQLEGALLLGQNTLASYDAVQSLQLLAHIRRATLGQHLYGDYFMMLFTFKRKKTRHIISTFLAVAM